MCFKLHLNVTFQTLKPPVLAEDAVLAVEVGVSGIVVSNHGGRQLDTIPATVSQLSQHSLHVYTPIINITHLSPLQLL